MFINTTNNELINADKIWMIKQFENTVVARYIEGKDATVLGEYDNEQIASTQLLKLTMAMFRGDNVFNMEFIIK